MILASGSPQRLALLREHGVDPAVVPADVDETPRPDEDPGVLVGRLAAAKARRVAGDHPAHVVLAADTVVVLDGVALGKPRDDAHARAMLSRLAGREVAVVTDVAVRGPAGTSARAEVTRLRFRTLRDDEVTAYVATGEPHGAAGAFRIQGRGAALVAELHGCVTNVVGLPVCVASELLREHGVVLRPDACAT